jgi:guanylate kinase
MELDERLRQKVAAYKPTPEDLDPIRHAPILFTAGPTGAGKGAIIDELLKRYPNDYVFFRSHITRPLRPYETEGDQYYFIDFKTAEAMLDGRKYIEANIVHADHIYGTAIDEVKHINAEGKTAAGDITVEGCDDFINLGLNVKVVFLLPPSYEVWIDRFNKRNDGIATRELKNRLNSALTEIAHALESPHYYIVINDKLGEAVELTHQIAQGEDVPPHYHKAVAIGEDMVKKIRAHLGTLDA